MAAASVVPAFDGVEEGEARGGLGARRSSHRWRCRRRHRHYPSTANAGLAAAPAEGGRRVLAALIRMMNHVGRSALGDGHVERGQRELGAEMGGHRPADDAATPRVEHHGSRAPPGALVALPGRPRNCRTTLRIGWSVMISG